MEIKLINDIIRLYLLLCINKKNLIDKLYFCY